MKIEPWMMANDTIAERMKRILKCDEVSPEMTNFNDTQPRWVCRGCGRSKWQIAKADKNGRLLFPMVLHHDHLRNYLWAQCEMAQIAMPVQPEAFERFLQEMICSDCNGLDSWIRANAEIAKVEPYFSLSPHEMRILLRWKGMASGVRGKHAPDPAAAKPLVEMVMPSYQLSKQLISQFVAAAMARSPSVDAQ